MKQSRKIIALLLALVLMTGLLPSAVFAQEPDNSPAPAQEAVRANVQLGADALCDADTLILGSAQSDGAYYPLEWTVADAEKGSMGRPGGALLVSKYLLGEATTDSVSGGIDTAASYGSIAVSDTKTAAITMPASYAVLNTSKNDTDYVANLGDNFLGLYDKTETKNTGFYTVGADTAAKQYSLAGAKFFALSAQELETYFPNDTALLGDAKGLVRRPYAAGYAVEQAAERTYALRGSDLDGKDIVLAPAASDNLHTQDAYTAQAGGLVGAKGEQKALSRPAFNLRKNAITFLYAADVTENANDSFGTILTTETPLQIAETQGVRQTGTVTGSTVWRAALEALPMIHSAVSYKQDGTLVVDFPDGNANGYKIGVLEAAEDGSILCWGTARLITFDKITIKPDADVSKLFFFAYTYDTNTCQMLTSNLVEVSAARPSAMTLGATEVRDGDQIRFSTMTAYVISADTGSTGMQNTGIIKNDGELNSTLTKGAGYKDQYPVKDEDAMFLVTKLPREDDLDRFSVDYSDTNVFMDLSGLGGILSSSSVHGYSRDALDQIVIECRERVRQHQTNADAVNRINWIQTNPENVLYKILRDFSTAKECLSAALAYSWVNDDSYYVDAPYAQLTTEKTEHAVYGKKVFPISAGEFLAAPQKVRDELDSILLRTNAEREESYEPYSSQTITVKDAPMFTQDGALQTIANLYSETEVYAAVGFNLQKAPVVFMHQKNAFGNADENGLMEVIPYQTDQDEWLMSVQNESLSMTGEVKTKSNNELTFELKGIAFSTQKERSSISLIVTDSAGTVKKYGSVKTFQPSEDVPASYSIKFDVSSMDYGDRLYAINEYGETSSKPILIWEKELAGKISILSDGYYAGEMLAIDTSKVQFSGAESLEYSWYDWAHTYSHKDTFQTDETMPSLYARLTLKNKRQNYTSAYVEAQAALPVYPGTKDQDFFKGGRLFFGAKDDSSDYSWAIAGKATGVSSISDTSGNRVFSTGLSADNALELLSTNAYEGGSGTSLNGYMTRTVVRTSTSDEAFREGTISGIAGSANGQTVFSPAYTDYQKLSDSKTSLFAAAAGSSDAASYLLRNISNRKVHISVDGWTQLQQKSNNLPTRDAINVNNKTIAFYSPAACDLTYASLKNCRQCNDGNWKLTVCDPRSFYRTGIESASVSGSTVSVSGTWASIDGLENVCVTAWAEKNGEITWLDSVPLESEGDFSETLTIPNGISYDDVYAVVRVDNGKYRTDICSVPMPATPTEVKVEVYVNGRLTDTGCHYTIKKQGTNETKFNTGDLAVVYVYADEGFMIQSSEVFFSDGTSDDFSSSYPSYHGPYREETLAFYVKGIFPTVRIDLSTVEYKILTGVTTYDRNHNLSSVSGGTINVQSGALKDETFNFTVDCKEGYFLFDLRVDGVSVNPSGWINIPTKDGYPIPAYKPGLTYSATMPAHDIRIEAEVRQIPGFILTLIAEPSEGGTLTAELPEGESLDDLLGGSEAKLNPTANEGWKLEKLTYQEGENGEELPFEEDENGYTFIMPYSNVTVKAQYAKAFDVTSELVDVSDLENPKEADGTVRYIVNGKETESFAAGEEVTVEITCAENLAVTAAEATPELELTRTGKYTFTFTMPANDVHLVFNCKKLAVRSAYLHVNQDINLIYTVQVPDGFTNPTATFSFMDRSYETSEYTVGADGRYHFEFVNVTPQCMGEPVDVTVTANFGDYSYSHTNAGYSVRDYCTNMLQKTDDGLLRTLLSDILVYGEKAQLYTQYKTDELVTEAAELSASTYPGLSGLHEKFVGTADTDVFWSAASLNLSNNVSLVLKFHASDIKDLSVTMTIGGRSETFTEFTPVEGQEDFYTVSFRGIYATEFDYPVSASFCRDGGQIGNTLLYSVNIYVCNKQNDGSEVFAELVKALYNYGASSLKYYQERMLNK